MRLIDLLKPKRHNMENEVDAILIHIDHSKPIEINEFTTALNAAGNLFSSFVQEKGNSTLLSFKKKETAGNLHKQNFTLKKLKRVV